jgi:hypothetical protein
VTSYTSGWDSEYFGFDLDFHARATADDRGLIVSGGGSIPVQVFGVTGEFMGIDARAQVLPAYNGAPTDQTPGFEIELRFAGVTVFQEQQDEPSFSLGCDGVDEVCKFSKELAGGQKSFNKFLYPVTVTGKLTGNIGVDYALTITPTSLTLDCEPYANLEASAEVNISFGLFGIGVIGTMTLVEERFKIQNAAQLQIVNDGFSGGEIDIALVPSLTVINELTGAQGYLTAYFEYSEPAWCSGDWWNPGYPCLRTVRVSADLVRWNGFKREDSLLDRSKLIRLVTIGGQTAYYDQ